MRRVVFEGVANAREGVVAVRTGGQGGGVEEAQRALKEGDISKCQN